MNFYKFNGFKIQISHWCRGMSKGLFVEEFIPFHYDDRANFAMKINWLHLHPLTQLAAISSSLYRLSTRLIISHHDNEEKSFHFSFAL